MRGLLVVVLLLSCSAVACDGFRLASRYSDVNISVVEHCHRVYDDMRDNGTPPIESKDLDRCEAACEHRADSKSCAVVCELTGKDESCGDCCKVCTTGKACGDSCIDKSKTCTRPTGCACDG